MTTQEEVLRVVDEPDFIEQMAKLSRKASSQDHYEAMAEKWIEKRAEKLMYVKGPFL